MSTRFSQSMEMSRLTRDGTAETVSRGQIIRRERGQGKVTFPCSADNVQDGQPFTRMIHTLVGDISIIFPCSFAVGITQQYGIYVLLG